MPVPSVSTAAEYSPDADFTGFDAVADAVVVDDSGGVVVAVAASFSVVVAFVSDVVVPVDVVPDVVVPVVVELVVPVVVLGAVVVELFPTVVGSVVAGVSDGGAPIRNAWTSVPFAAEIEEVSPLHSTLLVVGCFSFEPRQSVDCSPAGLTV
ncbi:hypothetical protein [Rhodococcus sp. OK519]|uniref:hypothetical protein n=1 Tax=Rhodococcus sp. OK519 TaxID=2135729 RepID=UPI0011B2201A